MEKLQDINGQAADIPAKTLHNSLNANLQFLNDTMGASSDLVIRQIHIGKNPPINGAVVMIDGLINDQIVNESVIQALFSINFNNQKPSGAELFIYLEKKLLPITSVSKISDWQKLFSKLLSGESIIFVDGAANALATNTKGGEKRAIAEPEIEVSLRGPREAYTESLRTNTALIRKRIKNPNLWMESFKIGTVTQTDVAIMYVNGIANDKIVQELRNRLNRIDIDQVPIPGILNNLSKIKFYTFPTTYHSERPDVTAADLAEGKIAIVVDGSPFVITVPTLFIEFFKQPMITMHGLISFVLRLLRV